jgi:iron complex outermembrane receptor protein
MNLSGRRTVAAACLVAALATVPCARAVQAEPASLADLSLEELLQSDVQTASRKAQRLQDVAAAVFVITREDIERSGATSIPESLRLAPGVEVARIANNKWAVSARGFNGRFANKLLVLVDGRSIYSPLFSGVLWEMEDTLLEDIDRIEVIRGPGAALWGANAVNGVINIITRKAGATRGTLAVAGAGTEDRGFVALRHGMTVGSGDLRLWIKGFSRDRSVAADGQEGNDTWSASRMGFRGDWSLDGGRRLTLSGEAYGGTSGDRWNLPSLSSATGVAPTAVSQEGRGAHLLARHEWLWSNGSEAALQAYVDRYDLNEVATIREVRHTVDVDFQHRPRLGNAHDIVWGVDYRESRGQVASGEFIAILPDRRTWRMASLFLQDEITLRPDRLRLILGTRLEHNNFTGFEPQPNLRLLWTPTPQLSLWGAASRAVRTPSRAELDAVVNLSVTPATDRSPAVLLRNVPQADHRLEDERVRAFELGWRQLVDSTLSYDVAWFHNLYGKLRTATLGAASFDPSPVPHVVQEISRANEVMASTRGLEVSLDWHPAKGWRVQPAYTYTRIHASQDRLDPLVLGTLAEYEHSAPRHQLSLRTSVSVSGSAQVDGWLRRVGRLQSADPRLPGVPAYTALDLRYAWCPWPALELSIVGQNLLQRRHTEIVPDLLPSQTLQVQRALYLKAKWQF